MPKGIKGFQKKNTLWNNPNSKKAEIKKGQHLSSKTEFKKGCKTSQKIRKKMSKALMGNTHGFQKGNHPKNEFRKGHKSWNKRTKGIMKPNSGSFKKGQMMGEKNHNWKGGITSENQKIRMSLEYKLWREAVYQRDFWTCQICRYKGQQIIAHHIKPFNLYSELRFAIDNGITLCRSCHIKWHKPAKNYA